VYGVRQLEKTFRSTLYATLTIQGFALTHLLECMVETFGFALSVDKLDVKFFDSLFEMCNSAT